MKKAYLVHGWGGSSTNCWFPWLKAELKKEGFHVTALQLPTPDKPTIDGWVRYVAKNTKPDMNTIFIGHSIGCQTILRFLEQTNAKVLATFFVAGWFHLTLEGMPTEIDKRIASPWLKSPIDFKQVRKHCVHFTAIFSRDDPYVPVSDAKLFKNRLRAKIIIEEDQGHYDYQKKLSLLLAEIRKHMKNNNIN